MRGDVHAEERNGVDLRRVNPRRDVDTRSVWGAGERLECFPAICAATREGSVTLRIAERELDDTPRRNRELELLDPLASLLNLADVRIAPRSEALVWLHWLECSPPTVEETGRCDEDTRGLSAARKWAACDTRERTVHSSAYEAGHVYGHERGLVAELAPAGLLYTTRIRLTMAERHEHLDSVVRHLLLSSLESCGFRDSFLEIRSLKIRDNSSKKDA